MERERAAAGARAGRTPQAPLSDGRTRVTTGKRLAWCAMNAFAAYVGLLIVTGLYDENVAYPVGGPWSHEVFRYGSRLDTLTWLDVTACAVVGLAIGITWWRTRPD